MSAQRKKVLIIGVVILLVLGLGAGVYYLTQSNLDGRSDASSAGLNDYYVLDGSSDYPYDPEDNPEDPNYRKTLKVRAGLYAVNPDGTTGFTTISQNSTSQTVFKGVNSYFLEVTNPDGSNYEGFLEVNIAGSNPQKWGNYFISNGKLFIPKDDLDILPDGTYSATFRPYAEPGSDKSQELIVRFGTDKFDWSDTIDITLTSAIPALQVQVGIASKDKSGTFYKAGVAGDTVTIKKSEIQDENTSYFLDVIVPTDVGSNSLNQPSKFSGTLEAYIPSTGKYFDWLSVANGSVIVPIDSNFKSLPSGTTTAKFRNKLGVLGTSNEFDKYSYQWSNPITVVITPD